MISNESNKFLILIVIFVLLLLVINMNIIWFTHKINLVKADQEILLNRITQLEQVIKVTHNETMLLHLDPKGFIKEFEIGSYRDKWNKDKWLNSKD